MILLFNLETNLFDYVNVIKNFYIILLSNLETNLFLKLKYLSIMIKNDQVIALTALSPCFDYSFNLFYSKDIFKPHQQLKMLSHFKILSIIL